MTDAAFWDRVAPKYALRPISDPDAYEKTLERVRSHLGAEDRVLELGCGTGSTALRLAPAVARYTGTDLSPGMIAIAQEKLGSEKVPGLDFAVADAQARDFSEAAFDAVLGFNLFHLVRDLDDALARARSLLKPGGLFISKTPCIGRKWYFRPVIGLMQMVGKAPFVRFLKVEDWDARVRHAGFEIVETGLYPPSAPSRFIVARKL